MIEISKNIIIIFSLGIFFSPNYIQAKSFNDVTEDHFAEEAIQNLSELEIIQGYCDGSFKPDRPITRVEALKIILKSADLVNNLTEENKTPLKFTDINLSAWYIPFLQKAFLLGIINGNPDGTFMPENQINKVELLKILIESYEIDLSDFHKPSNYPYPDFSDQDWFYPYINYAIKFNLISPTTNGLIQPGERLSRAQAVEIVYRFLLISEVGSPQKLLNQAESELIQAFFNLHNKDYQSARNNSESSLNLINETLGLITDESTILGPRFTVQAMDKLTEAYLLFVDDQKVTAVQLALEAKQLAYEAEQIDEEVKPLTEKIFAKVEIILEAP